ncbi:hypothetical protein ACPPVO_35755 [Dactylosporangium sp. McL0621]|uniref:hypothetical protein n=1 Tax=Dactylosporangium sp. McL0621 TaxID=3415678 RepID=UPI003CF43C9B
MRETFFQRRAGLATLVATTAGGNQALPGTRRAHPGGAAAGPRRGPGAARPVPGGLTSCTRCCHSFPHRAEHATAGQRLRRGPQAENVRGV